MQWIKIQVFRLFGDGNLNTINRIFRGLRSVEKFSSNRPKNCKCAPAVRKCFWRNVNFVHHLKAFILHISPLRKCKKWTKSNKNHCAVAFICLSTKLRSVSIINLWVFYSIIPTASQTNTQEKQKKQFSLALFFLVFYFILVSNLKFGPLWASHRRIISTQNTINLETVSNKLNTTFKTKYDRDAFPLLHHLYCKMGTHTHPLWHFHA